MGKRLFWALAIAVVAYVVVALWDNLREKPETLHTSGEQWRGDLQYLARELPRRHANAFNFTPRDTFEKAVADLDAQLAHANADEAWVGFQRITSLIGDAHTYLQTPKDAADFNLDIARSLAGQAVKPHQLVLRRFFLGRFSNWLRPAGCHPIDDSLCSCRHASFVRLPIVRVSECGSWFCAQFVAVREVISPRVGMLASKYVVLPPVLAASRAIG